jgi:hypothetical protein
MANEGKYTDSFIESIQKGKECAKKSFKNRRRWSRLADMSILDGWARFSLYIFENRPCDDVIEFLRHVFPTIITTLDIHYLEKGKRIQPHWSTLSCRLYASISNLEGQDFCNGFSGGDMMFVVDDIMYTLEQIEADRPNSINFEKLTKPNIRMIRLIASEWLKHTEGHKAQLAWGAKFETSGFFGLPILNNDY